MWRARKLNFKRGKVWRRPGWEKHPEKSKQVTRLDCLDLTRMHDEMVET